MAVCLLYSLKISITISKAWKSWEVSIPIKWKWYGGVCLSKSREFKRIERNCEIIGKTKEIAIGCSKTDYRYLQQNRKRQRINIAKRSKSTSWLYNKIG